MDIFGLPIETSEDVPDKTKAFIFPDKIVCHPDLLDKLKQGMSLAKQAAENDQIKKQDPMEQNTV